MRKPMVHHVVVVDDDAEIREALADALTTNGYRTTTVADGAQLWQVLKESACDLLVIDLYLDRENGLQLARQVRQESDVPIIMLTGKGDETDRILGLELVADDFLMKPFNLRELLARINALIRRCTRLGRPLPAVIDTDRECLLFGEWALDLTSRELRDGSGQRIDLTFGEYRLLEVLVRSPGRVFSRNQLLDRLHGMECDVYDRTIDVMVLRLRRKIEPNSKKPHYILTKRGAGYFFSGDVRTRSSNIGKTEPGKQLIMAQLVRIKAVDEAETARFEQPASIVKQVHHFLHSQPTAAPMVVFFSALVVFSIVVGDRFLHPFNLSLILQQVTIISILGIAQTLIILTAGIDLSVGAIMVLPSVVMGRMAVDFGVPAPLAIATGMGVGAMAGSINGVLITRFKLPPFIATLGSWSIFWALNLWYSSSETIRSQDLNAAAPFLKWTGLSFNLWGARLTYGSIIMILVFALVWYALNHTAWGKHVCATGDDPETAQLVGIATGRILFSVYVLAGVICAIGAWVLIGRLGSVTPIAGQTANLDSITAVVIGGTSLFGGRGSIAGTLIGALIVGVFRNGLALAGIDVLWQEFTVGLLIIIAVAIDQWIRKLGS